VLSRDPRTAIPLPALNRKIGVSTLGGRGHIVGKRTGVGVLAVVVAD